MTTPKYNFALNRGETFTKTLQLVNSVGGAKNLTDYTASAYLKAQYTDVSASAVFTCSIATPTSGSIDLELPADVTTNLTGSCYLYDVRIVSGSYISYVLEGKVHVSPSVTL